MSELDDFRRDGFVILRDALPPSEVKDIVSALAPLEAAQALGRNDFEGTLTKRVYSLAGKGDVFMRLAENARVLEIVDAVLMPHWLLSNLQSIRIHPGETAQAWHADDAFYPVPRPHPTLAVSVIWALEDFAEDNGATEIIPKSHLWANEHPDDRPHTTVRAVMRAGSAIVFDGSTWHRGGANASQRTRLGVSPQYCQPWLRPQESMLLIAPPEVTRRYSDRGRSMLGYSIHPPFIGQVDGKHPLRLVDPDYRSHKTDAREVADRVLLRPEAVMKDPRS